MRSCEPLMWTPMVACAGCSSAGRIDATSNESIVWPAAATVSNTAHPRPAPALKDRPTPVNLAITALRQWKVRRCHSVKGCGEIQDLSAFRQDTGLLEPRR